MKRVLTRLTPTERERAREQWREDGRRAPRARAGALPALNALVQCTSLARAAREEDDAALADSTAAQGMGKIRGGAQGRGRSGRAVLLIDAARRSSVVLAAVRERRGEAAGGAGAVDARRGEEEDGVAGADERARAACWAIGPHEPARNFLREFFSRNISAAPLPGG